MGSNLHLLCREAPHIHISSKGVPPHHRCSGEGMLMGAGLGQWTSSKESLPSTVLVLRSDLLQVALVPSGVTRVLSLSLSLSRQGLVE